MTRPYKRARSPLYGMTTLFLLVSGVVAWIVSTLSGGGGALLLAPVVSYVLRPAAVAPILTLTSLSGSPSSVWMMRGHIRWEIVRWYLPGAVVGAFLGAFLFTHASAEWLQIVIGLFLISTIFQYNLGKRERTFTVRRWHFPLVGLLVSFFSGLIGGTGPLVNVLYLNHGVVKQEMVSTKSLNSSVVNFIKLATYAAYGALPPDLLVIGLALGVAAVVGTWLGKRLLETLHPHHFRAIVIALMVLTGMLMIWDQREYWMP